jgi:DNA-binding beta-propeller fold protein YncE
MQRSDGRVRISAVIVLSLIVAPAWGQDSVAGDVPGGGGLCELVPGAAPPLAGIAYAVQSDGDDQLYSIDLGTGVATAIGPVGFADVECLAIGPGGVLYGVDDITDQLLTIDLATGAGTVVGPLGIAFTDCGLAFDDAGALFLSVDSPSPFTLRSVDPSSGAATEIGPQGQQVTGLTWGAGNLFGLGGDGTDNLLVVDRATGAATAVGSFAGVSPSDGGLEFDGNGVLWGLEDGGCIFVLDPASGAATPVATTASGFEGLAIVPRGLIQAIPTLSGAGLAVLLCLLVGAALVALRLR